MGNVYPLIALQTVLNFQFWSKTVRLYLEADVSQLIYKIKAVIAFVIGAAEMFPAQGMIRDRQVFVRFLSGGIDGHAEYSGPFRLQNTEQFAHRGFIVIDMFKYVMTHHHVKTVVRERDVSDVDLVRDMLLIEICCLVLRIALHFAHPHFLRCKMKNALVGEFINTVFIYP